MKLFKDLTPEEQSEYKAGVFEDRMKFKWPVYYKYISENTIEMYYKDLPDLGPAFTHYKSLVEW